MFLSLLGLVLAFFGVVGGYSSSGIGEVLPWVRYDGLKHIKEHELVGHDGSTVKDESYAGLKYFCKVEAHECTKFTSATCSKSGFGGKACQSCTTVADKSAIPSVICVITYLLYAHNTWKRANNKDSNQAKIMCMFACFFAGWNFLGVLMTYHETCIKNTAYKAEVGLGLMMMGIGGSFLKFVCGFLHFSLPVENVGSSEFSDSDCTEETGESDAE